MRRRRRRDQAPWTDIEVRVTLAEVMDDLVGSER
jgi:hypothetical protein